jgi:type III secretory pathway component EscV
MTLSKNILVKQYSADTLFTFGELFEIAHNLIARIVVFLVILFATFQQILVHAN